MSWSFLWELAFKKLKFSCLMAQYARCSSSTGRWHAFPRTQSDRVTSLSESWMLSYMPIKHHSIAKTNLFCWGSQFSLKCDWSYDLTLQPAHSSVGDKRWQPYVWWNTSLSTTQKFDWKKMLTSFTYNCSRRTKMIMSLKNLTTTLWSLVLHATTSTYLYT